MLDSVDAVLAVLELLGESREESGGDAMARAGEAKSLPSSRASREAGLEVIYTAAIVGYLHVLRYRD
jgi:hypothetical protein